MYLNRLTDFLQYLFGFRLAIPVACGATGMCAPIFTAVNLLVDVVYAAVNPRIRFS